MVHYVIVIYVSKCKWTMSKVELVSIHTFQSLIFFNLIFFFLFLVFSQQHSLIDVFNIDSNCISILLLSTTTTYRNRLKLQLVHPRFLT